MQRKLSQQFTEGVPHYLSKHFWWAYLWRRMTNFFDHPFVISSILFGQYKKLKLATLAHVKKVADHGRTLQLTCVYGMLTPRLMEAVNPRSLHITDIVPLQLELARGKVEDPSKLLSTRMNAENLGYRTNSFTTAVIFFLLHELPPEARRKVLSECLRTIEPGGTLVVTEYSELPTRHFFYWFPIARWILVRAEPFLEPFWHEDLTALLNEVGSPHGKSVEVSSHETRFGGFYRVTEYKIGEAL
jgi:ubiquinone/menaquinone biosynthesis C-methylase UbiE